jgi:hypothetical protein
MKTGGYTYIAQSELERRLMALNLDQHDIDLVKGVKAALDAAIAQAHQPIGVAKRVHSLAARHRNKGRAAAMRRHPFAGICEASGLPLERKHAQLDELEPELGFRGKVRWVCSVANNNGKHSCGRCGVPQPDTPPPPRRLR